MYVYCICIYIYVHTYACIFLCTYTNVCICLECLYVDMCVWNWTLILCMYLYMHIHMYMCMDLLFISGPTELSCSHWSHTLPVDTCLHAHTLVPLLSVLVTSSSSSFLSLCSCRPAHYCFASVLPFLICVSFFSLTFSLGVSVLYPPAPWPLYGTSCRISAWILTSSPPLQPCYPSCSLLSFMLPFFLSLPCLSLHLHFLLLCLGCHCSITLQLLCI